MNVLFDISILGKGHFYSVARTGVYRVVENLAIEFSRMPSIDLKFSAFNSLEEWIQSRLYLASSPDLVRSPLTAPDGIRGQSMSLLADAYPRSRLETKVARIASRGVFDVMDLFAGFRRSPLEDSSELFHSTYYPLPPVERTGKLKRFVTIYDMIPVLFPEFFKDGTGRFFRRLLESIRPDDWVSCISESTKRDFCEYTKMDPNRVFVAPLGVSSSFFPAPKASAGMVRRKYGIPEGPYLLSVATLEPRKNVAHLIRAFTCLVKDERIPDLSLVLVGAKGWHFDEIFSAIGSSAAKERIFVTGFVDNADLAPLYSDALVFVYPSLYEGFGLPPLEAMKCGTPVITSNTSSLPEVVGDAGLLVGPKDLDALCESILRIYRNPSLRETLSRLSVERSWNFSWSRCAADTLAAYRASMRG